MSSREIGWLAPLFQHPANESRRLVPLSIPHIDMPAIADGIQPGDIKRLTGLSL
jgi:hypothetical protein